MVNGHVIALCLKFLWYARCLSILVDVDVLACDFCPLGLEIFLDRVDSEKDVSI